MKILKYFVSLMMAAFLVIGTVGCSGKETVKIDIKPDYAKGEKVTDNLPLVYTDETLTVSIDRDTCNVMVTENKSGRQWCTNPAEGYTDPYAAGISKTNIFSQLTVSYIDESNALEKTNSYVSSVKRKNFSVFKIPNGFRIEYTFKEGFMIPVEYVIKNGTFEAAILYTGITEQDGVKISRIGLLPYFGIATSKDDGFLLVPDGSGAVINFNNGKNDCSPYESKVYGVDESLPNDIVTSRTEQIYIPLVGMKKNDGAYMALATDGAAEALIKAQPSGIETDFNSIYFEAIYRAAENLSVINGSLGTAGLVMYSSEEPTDSERFTVRYAFVEQNPILGNMVDVAREKLLDEKSIVKGEDKATLYVDIYGGVSKAKSFMGIQYTGIEKLTTFEQAQQLIKNLIKGGAEDISVVYKNFSKNSFSGKLMADLMPVSALGGKKGMKNLTTFAKKNNMDLYFEADFYSFTSTGNGFSKYFDITKQLDLGAASVYPKKINTNLGDKTLKPYYMLSPDNFSSAAQRIFESAKKLGVDGVYLEDISHSLAGDYNIGGIKRSKASHKVSEALEEKGQKILLSSPNYYLWGRMDKATNVPISSSKHQLFDYDVPLIQMLIKGNVSYSGYPMNLSNTNDDTYLLHIAFAQNIHYAFIADDAADLQGTELIGLYGLSNSKIKDASQKAEEFSNYYSFVEGRQISDYNINGNASQTVYSDGTQVLVNYGENDTVIDGITVKARGWTVTANEKVVLTGGER